METLLEPLLALDYVLPHPGLPWLLTERGIVACFKQLGIDTKLLPKRIDARRTNGGIRYFHIKIPAAVEQDRADTTEDKKRASEKVC